MTAAALALRARSGGSTAVSRIDALPERFVLGPLAVVQWSLAAIVAATVGTSGSTALVVLQVVFLLPLTLALVYRIGGRIAGRVFAAWGAVVWIALPYVGYAYANRG